MDEENPKPASLGLTLRQRLGLVVFLVGIMAVHVYAIVSALIR